MSVRRGILSLWVPVLIAGGVAPLHAQFVAMGCPQGPSGVQVNGFTAGTPGPSQLCLTGTFEASAFYSVVLTSPLRTVTLSGTASTTMLEVTVPASFYASVSNPGQQDIVTIVITIPQEPSVGPQDGEFQINPPLQAGGPVFVSALNTAVSWVMYSGGTPPYNDEFASGSFPAGMATFPVNNPLWPGTPGQTGIFQFAVSVTDAWGNQIAANLAGYIVPIPYITAFAPTSVVAGSSTIVLAMDEAGFVSPTTIGSTPEPGTVLMVTAPNSPPVTLTPTNISANAWIVNLPSNLLASEGYLSMVAVNPGSVDAPPQTFVVTPSITGLSTTSRTAGTPAFALGVSGTGFANHAVVTMNGTPLPTTFVSATSLTATFPSDPTPGAVSLTVLNSDGTFSPQSSAAVLTILPQPTLSALSPASANAGGAAFQLTATGSHFLSGMTIFFNSTPVSTSLVPNQTNSQLTAAISAAAIASAGTVPVWVATSDGYTTPALYFTIASTTPALQLLTLSPLPAGVVNTAYSYTFTATGGAGGDAFSVISGALPAGLHMSSSGALSGTPTAIGTSRFTVQVTDSAGTSVARDFALTIAPQPLTLTTPPLANTLQNAPLSIQFAGSGGVPPYTFVEFGALPPGVTMTSVGLLSGTPARAGSYPLLVFINDSAGASASRSYTLNVALPGLLITPPSPLPAGQVNLPYTTQLAATGGIGPPYTWSGTGLPQGLTVASNSGLIAGIPRAIGTFTVAVTVGDYSGATATQNYTLAIASGAVTITTASLFNGAVGSSYSAGLAASGGSGIYTFTATGLPASLTLAPSGTLSGTPTTAGTFTVAVTATDSAGLTAMASFTVTIAPKLVVTGATISNAVLGTPIAATTLTATGGTPPYQWQAANPAPGLSLASNGTLSGTPTAGGTFSFTVFAVDSSGALASGTVQLTVALPTAPPLSISGLPASNAPATQPRLQVSLASPYPATVTVKLSLTFVPDSSADDPAIQFDTGGRTAQIVIPAGSTGGLSDVGVQTGTVAGAITITAQLLAGTQDVTPAPAPSRSIRVTASAPVITTITATRTSTGFTVVLTGYASSRDVAGGTYQFSGSAGANLLTGQLSTSVGSLFTQWYASAGSAPYGSQFTLTQPFTVTGSPSAVLSVTVTLTNSIGTSPAASANLQ